jgi:predicted Rossmann fold nucleotide-binding protein DprA/Smf involved in DNA uptake
MVTDCSDILSAINFTAHTKQQNLFGNTEAETALLTALASGVSDGSTLQNVTDLSATDYAQTLTMLEINGKIRSLGGDSWTIL